MTTETIKTRTKINPVTGCWEWTGAKRNGYGRLTTGSRTNGTRKTVSAHRLSYQLFKGEIPRGYEICHKCDNPCCINPDHLFAGTRQDNVDDREQKGRNIVPRGENNGRAKLTEDDVRGARNERVTNGTSYRTLAANYGVAKRTIMDAVRGVNWKCLEMPEPPKEE
jgi:hypothetical protein